MKHTIIRTILFAVFIIIAGRVYAQHVIIDYQAWNPSNPPCNLFATATNVPSNVGPIQHQARIGQPKYNTVYKWIEPPCEYVNTSSPSNE